MAGSNGTAAARAKAGASKKKVAAKKPARGASNGRAGAGKTGALKPAVVIKANPKKGLGEARVYEGDCRDVLARIPEVTSGRVDLVFADPPFNWSRGYESWNDRLPEREYLDFTYRWLDLCVDALTPRGSMWVNIPDTWAAEIVVHLKQRGLAMINWCIWHYRFGQNTSGRFINSKVHALYFARSREERTWNSGEILELSDRRTIYFDARTENKADGMPSGMRVPMDVWYGKYWGRIQGNNKERRHGHDNQLPEVYLERVVRACSNAGEVVLDPFLGSGTTGVIARALGRRFIGIEYSPRTLGQAAERIEAGPIRLGAASGQSTAIFGARRKNARAKADEG